jgi:hypothetical protein
MLQAARDRGTTVSLVLNRVPADARAEVPGHLREMLDERGLGRHRAAGGRGERARGRPVAGGGARARAALARRAGGGRLRPRRARAPDAGGRARLDSAAGGDRAGRARRAGRRRGRVREGADHAYDGALDEVDETVRSGSLLRGEVLARWHEVVGTGDFMRALEGAWAGCATACARW